jgi:predicted ATPase
MISTKGYGALETGAVFARARELSEKVEDSALLFPVLYQQWVYDLIGSRIQESQQRAVNFLQLAGEQDDSGSKIIGHRINAVSLFYRGELAAARDAFEAALALYDPAEHRDLAYRFGQDPRAACLAFLTVIDHVTGYPERAARRSAAAVEHAEQTKHANTLAYTLSYGPVRSAMIGRDLVAADGLFERLLALAEEQGLAMWKGYAQVYKGWRGMAGLSSTRTALDHPLAACSLAEAYGADGRHDDAIGALDDAIASAERADERWFEAEIHRLRAQWILTHGGDEAEAEAERHFHKSIGTARRQGARLWELRAATDLARLWGRQGERSRAFDLLAPLHGWFTEGLGTPDLMDADALQSDLA